MTTKEYTVIAGSSELMGHVDWLVQQLFKNGDPTGSRTTRTLALFESGPTPTDGVLAAVFDGVVDAVGAARQWQAAHPGFPAPPADILEMIGLHLVATIKLAATQSDATRAALHVIEELRKSVHVP